MEPYDHLTDYLRKKALAEGALLVGFIKIRKVEPVIIFGFPFTDNWFLKQPIKITKRIHKEYFASKHVQDITAKTLKSEGYTAHYKTIMSIYGDFRPLAVSAGLGEWGRNGIIVNKDHGSGLLFAAIFTNAPLKSSVNTQGNEHQKHCTNCEQCIKACPSKAFENNRFRIYRCVPNALKGCAECLKVCTKKLQ